MELVPAYACFVKGNASSWRKVLKMAGYGNSGSIPLSSSVLERMDNLGVEESHVQTEEEQREIRCYGMTIDLLVHIWQTHHPLKIKSGIWYQLDNGIQLCYKVG